MIRKLGFLEMGKDRFSVELCGGTHVDKTGDIGCFIITSQISIAAGVRRVEAFTGLKALQFIQKQRCNINNLTQALQAKPEQLLEKLNALQAANKKLQKQNSIHSNAQKDNIVTTLIKGVNVSYALTKEGDVKSLRTKVDNMKVKIQSGICVYALFNGKKTTVVVGVTDDLTNKISAPVIAKELTDKIGGSGCGGKPDFAQTGGKYPLTQSDLLQALKTVLPE